MNIHVPPISIRAEGWGTHSHLALSEKRVPLGIPQVQPSIIIVPLKIAMLGYGRIFRQTNFWQIQDDSDMALFDDCDDFLGSLA